MKAMILAAGEGQRLRPLTAITPKPLVKVGDQCLIEYHLLNLKKIGVSEVVINVSYLAEKIESYLGDGARYGLRLHYSVEPEILGTGGGIFKALPLLGEAPFLLISADIWSDYAYSDALLHSNYDAHLVLVENPDYHTHGDYGVDESGMIVRAAPLYTFAGMAKIHPRIFERSLAGNFSIAPLIEASIEKRKVSGELFFGAWFNIGTLAELEKLKRCLA